MSIELKYLDRPFEVKAVDDEGIFTGYVSVFGNVDAGGDIVVPGAFTDSLAAWKAKGKLPPVLWQHRTCEPLGPFLEMREDTHGLWVKGQLLVTDVPRAREARALLKSKALDGMSIGYVPRDDSIDRATGVRSLKKVDLYEGSIVTFGMNGMATVNSVKSAIDSLESLADAERFLRDAGGLSRSQATAFVARIKSMPAGQGDPDPQDDDLVALKQALQGLQLSIG